MNVPPPPNHQTRAFGGPRPNFISFLACFASRPNRPDGLDPVGNCATDGSFNLSM